MRFAIYRLHTYLRLLMLLTLLFVPACAADKATEKSEKTRPPAVAGAFYPADATQLAADVDGYIAHGQLSEKDQPLAGSLVALVAPHAGYQFSGGVAGHSYALLKGRKFARVVVIAPSHYEAFDFASIYDGDSYATPLGPVAVDKEFARRLAEANPWLKLSSRAHLNTKEHSLEVQLPFLQRALGQGQFKLVPIIMGEQSYEDSRAVGVALAKVLGDGNAGDTLIVASSDLSHYHPYDEAVQLDHRALNAITEWDYLSASHNFEARVWEACGGGPIVAAMIAAERLGANEARLLRYANSGGVTSDRNRVVGYSAIALVRSTDAKPAQANAPPLTSREQKELLRLARQSTESIVREHKSYEPPAPEMETLRRDRGAFVTLTKDGQLRGCIGYTAAAQPLYLAVRDTAALAAVRDRRFPAVSPNELGSLEYEISVLSSLRRVLDPKQIVVGRDGLLMRHGGSEGLLLPQVPGEFGWDRNTFLMETCAKAGMERQCWKDPETDIFSFTAQVFGDHQPMPLEAEPPSGKPAPPGLPAPHSPLR